MMRRLFVLALIAALTTPFYGISSAQCSVEDQAQSNIEQGLAAANRGDYRTAYAKFYNATTFIGLKPELIINLGLASSKIPGFELRAIAWFEAYLIDNPQAQNAVAVRAQIAAIETAYEAKLKGILDRLESLWKQHKQTIPSNNVFLLTTGLDLARARFLLGDVDRATEIMRTRSGGDWRKLLRTEARDHGSKPAAKFKAAVGFLGLVWVDPEDKIAASMISAGLFDEAMSLVAKIYDPDSVGFALERPNVSRAKLLVEKGTYYSWLASACIAAAHNGMSVTGDALKRAIADPDPKDRVALLGLLTYFFGSVVHARNEAGKNLEDRIIAIENSLSDSEREKAKELNSSDALMRCDAFSWSTKIDSAYHIKIANEGVILNTAKNDTELVDFIGSLDLATSGYIPVSPVASAAAGMANLVLVYRRIRGPQGR